MKPWFASRTMWGGIAAVVLSSTGLAINIDFTTGDFHGNIYDLWAQIGAAIGGLIAMYGRFHAKTPIASKSRRRAADDETDTAGA